MEQQNYLNNQPVIFEPIPEKKTEPVKSLPSVETERTHVLYKMYVSNVGNRLREMDVPSDVDCQRWAWELMQNAKDSIADKDAIINKDKVDIQLFLENDKVIFMHNGLPFTGKAYLALLYKYSDGKANNAESTGRFGTGFLTTHSLSKIVKVEGDVFNIHDNFSDFNGSIFEMSDNIAGFEVTMYRDGSNPEELIKGIERMEEEKKYYIGEPSGWTKYTYILKTKRNHESSELGFNNFKINIAQTMLFNSKFGIVQLTYKNGFTTTIKHLCTENFGDVNITTFQLQNENIWQRKFIISSIFEHSDELSIRFEQDRNLRLSGCIELTENNELTFDPKSPCLFCSLPLVGSEKHEMPITLNSDDFEPNTERQGILLKGSDKKQDRDCLSDVGINQLILRRSLSIFESIVKHCSERRYKNLHILTRGLKKTPIVERDFDKDWFKPNIIVPMRNILKKYPIVFTDDEIGLKKIEDVFIPIYPSNKDVEYKRQFHHFSQIFFGPVPRFEESIEWSERIWKKELNNLVDVERLLNTFKNIECDFETKKSFIEFAWNNHKELLYTIPVLINQKDEFVKYTDEFADGSDVQEDAVDLMEELGIEWRSNHLHRKITSIQIPLHHDHQFAMGMIKENNHQMKKFIMSKYIIEGNDKREKMFKFAIEFFPDEFIKDGKVIECYKSSSIDNDLWNVTDTELFRDMMSIIEDNGQLDNVKISNFIEFIEFIRNYYSDVNVFDKRSLIPSKLGIFHKLNQLYEAKEIPQFLLTEAKNHLDYDISDQIKDPSITCVIAPKEFNINNFMNSVNRKLADDGSISDENKLKMSLSILSFLPIEEGELKDYQINLQNAAKELHLNVVSNSSIANQNKLFWEESNSIVIHEIEQLIQNCINASKFKFEYGKNIDQYLNKYINFLHPNKFKLIPNQLGDLCFLSDLSNDINIPEKVKDVFNILKDDLKPKLKLASVEIECPKNESIDTIIGKLNDDLKKVDAKAKKDAAELIIDMLPSDSSMVPKQTNIQNLYHKLTKTSPQVSTIECSNEAFWIMANKIIIKYCETLISLSKNLTNLCAKTGIGESQYIDILNTFSSILNIDENPIIPNYYGQFRKKSDLYIIKLPEGIFKAIKDYLNRDLFVKFIDKRVEIEVVEFTIFDVSKIINSDISKVMSKNSLELSKAMLQYIPDEKQISDNLKNLLNIVNKFDGTNIEPIEIELCEGLYSKIKPIIHDYINKKVESCKNLNSLSCFFPDPIEFINNNSNILNFYSYTIVPDQENSFHNLADLQNDDGIYDELKQILRNKCNVYKLLIHKEIKSIRAIKSLTNDSMLKLINNHAYEDEISFQMLHVLPQNSEDLKTQEKLLYLFQHFTSIKNPTVTLDLPGHFWMETNKHVIAKIIQILKNKKSLESISKNSDEAIEILKTVYEFASPSSKSYRRVKMVPNQLGELLCFDELYNEQNEIPDKFKDVLEKHFSFDIRKRLQDSRLSIKVEQSLSVDSSDVIDAINRGFISETINYTTKTLRITKPIDLTEKSQAFIIFQPKGEKTRVHNFIHCYKNLLNLDFEPITLLTSNATLWDVAIKTLTKLIIKQLIKDKNLTTCAKRISKNENDVIMLINSFQEFASSDQIYPNMNGEFHYPSEVFTPENIDDEILDILSNLSPSKDFRKILVHPNIEREFSKKKIDDLASTIDVEIQLIMKDEKRMNDENVKKSCKSLIMTWMLNHPDKSNLFRYVEKKKHDIILEIILDKEKRDEWKEMEKTNPGKLLQLMMNVNAPINIKHEVLEDLKDIDLQKEDVQVLKQLKRGNNSRTLTTINSLNDEDQQYLNEHPYALSEFIRNQRENEERMREQQRQMEIMRRDRERRLLEMMNLNAQRNIRPRNHHRNRNQNIHNFVNNIPFVNQQQRPYMETLNDEITSMLRKIFKTVNYNDENNCYYCSLVEDNENADEYLILPLTENENNEIELNQDIVEITNDFQDTSIILIVPSENNFDKNNFINNVKIITNIGFDINDLNIVNTISELISINNEDFSFEGYNKYSLQVKENYISKNLKHFDDWSNSFKT